MKMIRVLKASNYKFIDYPDKNGSCYIQISDGRVEIHTASHGAWTVNYTTGKLADLGKDFKVFDNLKDAKDYALQLAKKYDFKVESNDIENSKIEKIKELIDSLHYKIDNGKDLSDKNYFNTILRIINLYKQISNGQTFDDFIEKNNILIDGYILSDILYVLKTHK